MNLGQDPNAILSTRRVISAQPGEIYAAFETPERLARWWGPSGFTNTFETFEFKPGGQWKFIMHGPNGIDYPNICEFRELVPGSKVVIDHVLAPLFRLTVNLKPEGTGTLLTWDQEFETAEVADGVRSICGPANEQNLDRLEAVLAETRG